MTRDELLIECFGTADFPAPLRTIEMLNEDTGAVLSHVDVYLRRVLVRFPSSPSSIGDGSTTIVVAGIAQVCTDPDYRGRGYEMALVRRAHAEMRERRAVKFAALFGLSDVYWAAGYFHPEGAENEHFLVCELGDEKWPAGSVTPQGQW